MPIEARLHRAHGALTTLTNGRHSWSSDVDKTLGSSDAAPDPHDLLDSALAACTVLTLELYARRKQLAVTGWRVEVAHTETKGADGRVHYSLRRRIHVEGQLTDEERQRVLDIANKCPIHRILTGAIEDLTELA
jgi:putative redox protein